MPIAPNDRLHLALAACPALREGRCLIGVSGGRDSVALLHALVEHGFRRLVVCHLDHGLRGNAGRADARFAASMAAKYDLPFELGRVSVPALVRAGKQSIETAARDARFAFFAGVAARRRCRQVLLAHQADDQIETLLFNLFRGTGPAGLAGMRIGLDAEDRARRRSASCARSSASGGRRSTLSSTNASTGFARIAPTPAPPTPATASAARSFRSSKNLSAA